MNQLGGMRFMAFNSGVRGQSDPVVPSSSAFGSRLGGHNEGSQTTLLDEEYDEWKFLFYFDNWIHERMEHECDPRSFGGNSFISIYRFCIF